MGHLGRIQARYDVLPVPALTTDDVAAAGPTRAETSRAHRRPDREPSGDPSVADAPTPRD